MRRRADIAIAALAALWSLAQGALPAVAGELLLRPTLTVGEEWTDNVYETADGRKAEYTTRVRPGAAVSYRSPFMNWDSAYNFDYRIFARGTKGDEELHNLVAKGKLELVEHLLFLELNDELREITVNVSRDAESESLLSRRTTQNLLLLSPYLVWSRGGQGELKAGYRYARTNYWEGEGIGKTEHGAFASFSYQFAEDLGAYASYGFTRGDDERESYLRHDVSAGMKYGYAENCFLFAAIGNSWLDFSGGPDRSYLFWNAGITHDFRLLTALLETKVQDVQDPLSISTREVSYSARLDRTFSRGALGLAATYAEFFLAESDTLEHRRLNVTGSGRYDLSRDLSLSASISADRFSHQVLNDYPYRLTCAAGLNYRFFNEYTALALSYSYRQDRHTLDGDGGDKTTNRVLLELRTGI